MHYRKFGRTEWNVSEIGYGMWGLAGWTGSDDAESLDALQRAVDLGCNFFDTALSDIAKGSASSVTRASPRESRCRIARRVGSASAIKVWFSPDCLARVIIIQPIG